MSTRLKVLIQVLITQAILMGGIYWVAQISVQDGHAQLEKRFLKENHARLIAGMTFESEALTLLVYDWAQWDDTYEFITRPFDPTDPYVISNLPEDMLNTIEIELILYLDAEGRVVVGRQTDGVDGSIGPVNPQLLKNLSAQMGTNEDGVGYVYADHDLWLAFFRDPEDNVLALMSEVPHT